MSQEENNRLTKDLLLAQKQKIEVGLDKEKADLEKSRLELKMMQIELKKKEDLAGIEVEKAKKMAELEIEARQSEIREQMKNKRK